jgi:dTDP-4-dehydrorhamnose reductase
MLTAPVVVTGHNGRLGRAVIGELRQRSIDARGVGRPDYDLDDPDAARRLIDSVRPATVIHCAAWTDVDGCALDPDLAMRRNGTAVAELAAACSQSDARLVLLSTNEVFDGTRSDDAGYREEDAPRPLNAYGESKLAGERAAQSAFEMRDEADKLWIIRTAWLYGPPGNDFPAKIVAAAERRGAGSELPVVSDEIGSPTYTNDLAPALIELIDAAPGDTYHLVAQGAASRFEVAAAVLERCRLAVIATPISRSEFKRPSVAPAWAVLNTSRPASFGGRMRRGRLALAEYLDVMCAAAVS